MKNLVLILMAFFPLYLFGQDSKTEFGKASYYSDVFQNKKTANGEKYHKDSLTAAHLKYPFGTYIRVTNLQNQKSVVVRINDRGPVKRTRMLDLSKAAAKEIGMMQAGVVPVKVEFVPAPGEDEDKEEENGKGKDDIAKTENEKPSATAKVKVNEESKAEKAPAIKTKPVSSATKPYSIQVAALREKANLEKLTTNLRKNGYEDQDVVEVQKEDVTLYKVTIGSFSSETEALASLKKLKSQKFDGFIVKK